MPALVPNSPDPGLYGRSFADVYDEWYGDITDPAAVVGACTAHFAAGARIVEFGSGSARLAAPLAEHGFSVIGLDASSAMLRQSPDHHNLASVASDMAQVGLASGSADGIVIAYNTLFNVADAMRQQRCLAEASRVLRSGGLLVIECFIATPVEGASSTMLTVRSSTHDQAIAIVTERRRAAGRSQHLVGSHIELRADDIICRPWELYYRPPGELDTAAATVGLDLHERFATWQGEPFDPLGPRHVSWYRRTDSAV